MSCLLAAIGASGIPRQVLAEDHLKVTEGEFSKLLSGRFRLEQLHLLPPTIYADWQRRMEEGQGAERDRLIVERAAHALIDALPILQRLASRRGTREGR